MGKTFKDDNKYKRKAVLKGLRDSQLDETRNDNSHRLKTRIVKNKKKSVKKFDYRKDSE
jgi:hypothetical protein